MFPYLRFAQFGLTGLALSASFGMHAQQQFGSVEAEQVWQAAQQSFIAGDAEKCHQQLGSLSDLLIGEISYDRLLGLCSAAAGQHDEALLAFERIMAQQPRNAEIRLERARTLYLLGQLKEAQEEFRFLAANNPPASARPVIQDFLKRIQEGLTPKLKVSTRLQINVKAGHDSNANNASELQEFLGFLVSDNSRSTESTLYGADIRLRHSRPVSKNLQLSISTILSDKRYPDADFVDQSLGTLSVGLAHIGQRQVNRFDVFAYGQSVDSALNSKGAFARFSHSYRWKPNVDIGAYYKGGAIRYQDSLRIKDVNQYTLGATARYRMDSTRPQSLNFDVNVGRDYPVFKNSNYRRDIYNLRVDHNFQWSSKWNSRLVANYYAYDFKSPFFAQVFPEPRDDEQLAVMAELRFAFNDQWSLTPKVGYNDLSSSVDIYEYDRFYYELNLTHEWNW